MKRREEAKGLGSVGVVGVVEFVVLGVYEMDRVRASP